MFHDITTCTGIKEYFTICLFTMSMFHGMFVYESGLRREQGTKNETLALQEAQQVSKPKYEATALHVHPNVGHPKSTTGSMYNSVALLLTGEATKAADMFLR